MYIYKLCVHINIYIYICRCLSKKVTVQHPQHIHQQQVLVEFFELQSAAVDLSEDGEEEDDDNDNDDGVEVLTKNIEQLMRILGFNMI